MRKRIRFNRAERRALEVSGHSRRDLTRLRQRILAGPPSFTPEELQMLTVKDLVGLAVWRERYSEEVDSD